uniref:Uncharacterized protein n=1 Tax=Anguilla anguilla TaxID=7936 RepID=A0A0E9XP07_ANGAN
MWRNDLEAKQVLEWTQELKQIKLDYIHRQIIKETCKLKERNGVVDF